MANKKPKRKGLRGRPAMPSKAMRPKRDEKGEVC